VRAAATKEESEKGLQSALTKYENNGMLRLYDAASKMNQNKFDEAIREFRAAKEYSQVKAAATAGLTRALIGYAGSDPNKALPVIHGMITESPEEAGLFQAAALGALYTDDIGLPNDQWGAKKSMYAAVNRWEQLAIKAGDPATTVGLTKAQYHTLAGNPVLARQEAIRVSGKNPNHVPTLLFLTESFLAERDFDQAQKYLDRANTEAKADDPTPALLEGAVLEGKGDLDAAAKLYERLMTQYAGNPAPFARRIAVATAQQKPGDALMWANKWVEKSPTDPSAILEQVIQLAKADPKSDAAVKKADEFVAKQVEAGEAQLKAAKPAPTPENAAKFRSLVRGTVMLQTATAFSRARNFPEAKKRVDVVLKEMPDSPAALLIAGDIAMIEQKWDDAAAVYQKRLDTDKRDFIAANNLAWVLAEKKNNPTGALKLVSDVRASRGGKPVGAERLPADFLDTIGTVYLKLNDANKFPEMRDTFEGAVKRYPTDPRMHSFLGQAYAAIGDNTNAVKSLKTAVRLASDPTVKAVSAGQKEEAKKAAEAALKKFGN
jgi:tetratricopeptide (TPR) repeat protein